MTNMIPRYHLTMSRETFLQKMKSGQFNGFYNNLSYSEINKDAARFVELLKKVGARWSWDNIEKYKRQDLIEKHLSKPETRLFHLLDNMKVIGYSLIAAPSSSIFKNMPKAFAPQSSVIEIENLGLFPEQAGNGKGTKYFEMIMADLFKEYDYVYWSMSSTNHPGLFNYYTQKIGMTHIGTEYVPDFRKEILQDNQQAVA